MFTQLYAQIRNILRFNNFESIEQIEDKFRIKFGNKFGQYHKTILDIFNKSNLSDEDYNTSDEYILNILGLYYEYVKSDKNMAKKYYDKGIMINTDGSTHNTLGCYYINNNCEMAKYHFLEAIKMKNKCAILNLATLFLEKENNVQTFEFYINILIDDYGIKFDKEILSSSNFNELTFDERQKILSDLSDLIIQTTETTETVKTTETAKKTETECTTYSTQICFIN